MSKVNRKRVTWLLFLLAIEWAAWFVCWYVWAWPGFFAYLLGYMARATTHRKHLFG